MYREDFNIFTNNPEMIYLDSLSTSLTPNIVVEQMNEYYFKYKSNIERAFYKNAILATLEYEKVRNKVAEFLNANKDDIIFTYGATDASNKLINLLSQKVNKEKNEIIISSWGHHSDIAPIKELCDKNNFNLIITNSIEDALTKINNKTFLISHPLVSNVTGEIFEIQKIKTYKEKFNFYFISDLTSAAGHIKIDVTKLGIDAGYFSAHKMCGPTACGVLFLKREISRYLRPYILGGGVVSEIDNNNFYIRSDVRAFEAGTSNIAEVIGLGAAIDYINQKNVLNNKYIQELFSYTYEKLKKISKITIYSKKENNIGVIAFNLNNLHAHDVADLLAQKNICVRAGKLCSSLAIKNLNQNYIIRINLYFYNLKEEINTFIKTIVDL